MTEVLSQEEIDQLLTAVNPEGRRNFKPARDFKISLANFETSLTQRRFEPEKTYGIFQNDISVCRFSTSEYGEKYLADIEQKNREQGMGNIGIPHTNIKLINYSLCPKCSRIFSFKDLMAYYSNPKPDPAFNSRIEQLREDTRVCCPECDEYFIPALIISDGTPRNEVQLLCRIQTVNAIEKFFLERGIRVLSREKSNIMYKNGREAIRNDIWLRRLESKPTLIANLFQYTPVNLMLNLIDGTNIEKGDALYGEWKSM
jgi:hypothetical protein